jgi:hypothetical protein
MRQHPSLAVGRTGAAAAEQPKFQSRSSWTASFNLALWAAQSGLIKSAVYGDLSPKYVKGWIFICYSHDILGSFVR